MDFPSLFGFDDALFVDRFADDVHNATEHFFTDGNRNAATRIFNRHAANETVGRVHGNRANDVLADVLRDFEHQITCLIADRRIRYAKRRINLRQFAFKRYVDDRTNYLKNLTMTYMCLWAHLNSLLVLK